MFPIGSVIVINNFPGKYGEPKRRWFIYFGTTEEGYHILCTTTSRVNYYTSGTRQSIPYLILSDVPCFEVDSVLDVMGVYAVDEEQFIAYSPDKKCELTQELIRKCLDTLTRSDYVEVWIKDYLERLRFHF